MRSVLRVDEATELSIDDARSFNHFLRVTAGPARLDLSLATASALHDMLNDYFGPPEPEPIAVELVPYVDYTLRTERAA